MSAQQIDDYLAALPEPKRSTLERMRAIILEILPDAEQGISYDMPAFVVDGKVIVGFAAFKNHLAYLPHSGSVLGRFPEELASYTQTKGSLHFAVDEPLPEPIVRMLIAAKLDQLAAR